MAFDFMTMVRLTPCSSNPEVSNTLLNSPSIAHHGQTDVKSS